MYRQQTVASCEMVHFALGQDDISKVNEDTALLNFLEDTLN